jgi:formyltetrahydrofolate-dependent phosphoribosylglycinamide formyltransferase
MPTDAHGPARLAVLISGGGRTLVNIASAIARDELRATIVSVIASTDCLGVARARHLGLPVEVIPGVIEPVRLTEAVHGADWIVLAGYLKLVRVPKGYQDRIVNIHPALLPSFGGPGMYGHHVHSAVLAAGCKLSGCTVHLVDEHYDRGPIVLQRACPVHDGDTPQTLADRVFELEKSAYVKALSLLIAGRVRVVRVGATAHTQILGSTP